ncbi:phage head completion protein [Parasphingorhabdus cellanae]|uniref:Head-tail adaptor protein n=1 Tax=Parasphingorhabdus cellanae TaxID=2806553 RepID=A0ABX7T7H5_9SPHN|nr:head-tail adaptor protein [Parasphingorhabdus cellanae]QTD57559.1 head-tail adaptor protein [Parasphingorhabdus cellanae]
MSRSNFTGHEFSGLLRERISIARPSSQRDAIGSATNQSVPIGEFWASAEPLGTGLEALGNSRSALPRWRFTLRQTDAIRVGDHLAWGDRKMVVGSVSADHRFIPKTILKAEEKR